MWFLHYISGSFRAYLGLLFLPLALPVVEDGYVPRLRHLGHVRDILRRGGGRGGLFVFRVDDHSVQSAVVVIGGVVLAIGDRRRLGGVGYLIPV